MPALGATLCNYGLSRLLLCLFFVPVCFLRIAVGSDNLHSRSWTASLQIQFPLCLILFYNNICPHTHAHIHIFFTLLSSCLWNVCRILAVVIVLIVRVRYEWLQDFWEHWKETNLPDACRLYKKMFHHALPVYYFNMHNFPLNLD